VRSERGINNNNDDDDNNNNNNNNNNNSRKTHTHNLQNPKVHYRFHNSLPLSLS
jgi:hypothetical protein